MSERSESSNSDNNADDLSRSSDCENEDNVNEENEENVNEENGENQNEQLYHIDSVEDFGAIMFHILTPDQVWQYTFPNLDTVYQVFNEYGKNKGFSLRKHKTGHNKKRDVLWKSFVCSKQGARDDKYKNNPNRKREARSNTQSGCLAEFQVHVIGGSNRWYVSMFKDEHNHKLLIDQFVGRLKSHSRMTFGAVAEMNDMRDAWISSPKIYGSFAQQSGGFGNIGFNKKKMYNQLQKQRGMLGGDANAAIEHLRKLAGTELKMYWKHEVDNEGQLCQMFWCDGDNVVDYGVFGEVLTFDATYGRNRYKCPVIVFSGLNHHKQTVVFACAIVSNETMDTYIWMLDQLLLAMGAKTPKAVITDGDTSMRNAIARVFPDAHHRLCAWHLLHNAKSHAGQSKLKWGFKRCMFGDYEIEEFEEKWRAMVVRYDVGNIPWVEDVYEKKRMWATAYMRGKFFASLRTTSRCEGLHTQMGKYVGSRDSLYELLKHFQRCLAYMRNSEVDADLQSCVGDYMMITRVPTLENVDAQIYTKAVFLMYRDRLLDLACVNVVETRRCHSCVIYTIKKYTTVQARSKWIVVYYDHSQEWLCSCKGMESWLIPCVHILVVIVELGIHELPSSLVSKRWCKNAKEGLEHRDAMGNTFNTVADD